MKMSDEAETSSLRFHGSEDLESEVGYDSEADRRKWEFVFLLP